MPVVRRFRLYSMDCLRFKAVIVFVAKQCITCVGDFFSRANCISCSLICGGRLQGELQERLQEGFKGLQGELLRGLDFEIQGVFLAFNFISSLLTS